MKKLIALIMVVSLVAMANAAILSVETYDLGLSSGRLGATDADALVAGDVIGIKIVLGNNPFSYEGTAMPDYDGYMLSSMDVSLTTDKYTLAPGKNFMGADFIQKDAGLSPFAYSKTVDGFSSLSGVALSPIGGGPKDIIWNLRLTITEELDDATIALGLAGLSDYAAYNYGLMGMPWEYASMTQNDLAGTVVNVVPEPATIALLGLGGLLIRRKK